MKKLGCHIKEKGAPEEKLENREMISVCQPNSLL